MNKTEQFTLNDLYYQQLAGLLTVEKKFLKCFQTLNTKSHIEELKSALSPQGTEFPQLIERLTQCLTLFKEKGQKLNNEYAAVLISSANSIPRTNKPDIIIDTTIIHHAQQIFMYRIGAYQILYSLAQTIKQHQAAVLLEQSLKDNQNHYAYLTQIAANIIYPKANNDFG